MSVILELARPDLLQLRPYAHAAWDPALERLHANESPWRAPADESAAGLNRYPEPYPRSLAARLAELYEVAPEQVLVGRGSDEAIDLIVRGFCRAGLDNVVICPPTFGMYEMSARIQGAEPVAVPLLRERGYALDEAGIEACLGRPGHSFKIVFLCSPNNPTGNLLDPAAIERVCALCSGRALVVVDEAYGEFSGAPSFMRRLDRFGNLVVLRTLSKAFALAGARCGALIAAPPIVEFLGCLLPPYALPSPSIEAALKATAAGQLAATRARVQLLVRERERLFAALAELPLIRKVWPSATNFLLVECDDAQRCLGAARSAGLLVRDLSRAPGLNQAVRITVGTPEQNDRLLEALQSA